MARRKREEPSGGGAGWISTFADLMNLLLCFFVLLFSMSTVDADKYEAIVTSLSNSIDIFDGGSPSIGEGSFISSGADQMVSISEYFNEYDKTGDDSTAENNADTEEKTDEQKIKDKLAKEEEEQKREQAEAMYEEIVGKATDKDIAEVINVNMDAQYQYVQISLKGAVLFDSGKADIKKNAKPVLNKIGDILKLYSKHLIKIEGHTDNVPISSSRYRNNMELSTARATSVFVYFVEEKKLNPKKIESSGRGEYIPAASNKTAKGRAKNRRIEIKIYTTEQ